MKVAVIGNSHLAAFKLGWELISDEYPAIEATFFGSPANTLHRLEVDGDRLTTSDPKLNKSLIWTSGGMDSIGPDYDRYVLVGMGFSFPHLMAILRHHRPAQYHRGGGEHLISDTCLDEAMEQTLADSTAVLTIDKVRRITDAPITYFPNPFQTTECLTKEDFWGLEDARDRMMTFYREGIARLLDPVCTVVEQPEHTLASPFFTQPEFARDAMKLKRGMKALYAENDYAHMNADFGAHALRRVIETL